MRSRVRQPHGVGPPRLPVQVTNASQPNFIRLESAVEDLGLSVRTRNALRGVGCDTVEDVLELDLANPIRGVGRKTKDELLTALDLAGFPHPALQDQPSSEIRVLEQSLERMERRLEAALSTVSKELRLLRQRLHRVAPRRV